MDKVQVISKKRNPLIKQYQLRHNIPFPHEFEIDPTNDPFHYKRMVFKRESRNQYRFDQINNKTIIKNRTNTNV